jgi:hypothetical protein
VIDAGADALDDVGVKVTEIVPVQRGGTAAMSGDLDMTAAARMAEGCHGITLLKKTQSNL